jgi:hypothetical protein
VSGSSLRLAVSAHLHPDTPVTVQLHPADARVVVTVGDDTSGPWIDLYLRRPALVALRDTLSAALADLDAATGGLTDTPTTSTPGTDSTENRCTEIDGTEHPGRSGSVRDTAA